MFTFKQLLCLLHSAINPLEPPKRVPWQTQSCYLHHISTNLPYSPVSNMLFLCYHHNQVDHTTGLPGFKHIPTAYSLLYIFGMFIHVASFVKQWKPQGKESKRDCGRKTRGEGEEGHLKRQVVIWPLLVPNGLDPSWDRQNVQPDLGPNCFQKLSADEKKIPR